MAENGSVKVINRCREGGLDGRLIEAVGIANIVDKHTNAKLEVSFYWPFYGDYWIIALGNNYEYAVISEPKRQYLWILSREPILQRSQYNKLIETLKEKYFDVSLLIYTSQEE